MKRCNSSLYALAVATGAGLLFAVPAVAGTAYTTYTQNFTNGGSNLPIVFNNPSSDNYNFTAEAGTARETRSRLGRRAGRAGMDRDGSRQRGRG